MRSMATLSLWLPFFSPTEALLAHLCRLSSTWYWPSLTASAVSCRLRSLGSSGAMAASQGFFSQPLGSSAPPSSLAGWNTAEALQQLQNKVTTAADSTLPPPLHCPRWPEGCGLFPCSINCRTHAARSYS